MTYLAQGAAVPAAPAAGDYLLAQGGPADTGSVVRSGDFGRWSGDAADPAGPALTGLLLTARPHGPQLMLQDPATGHVAAPGAWLGNLQSGAPLTGLRIWIEGADGTVSLHLAADFASAGQVEAQGTFISLQGTGATDRLLRLNLSLIPGPSQPRAPAPPTEPQNRIRIFRKT